MALFEQGMNVMEYGSGRTGIIVVEDLPNQLYYVAFEDGTDEWVFEGELVHAEFGEA